MLLEACGSFAEVSSRSEGKRRQQSRLWLNYEMLRVSVMLRVYV
jgi:hypothetical protein